MQGRPLGIVWRQRASGDLAIFSAAWTRVRTDSRASPSISSQVSPRHPQMGAVGSLGYAGRSRSLAHTIRSKLSKYTTSQAGAGQKLAGSAIVRRWSSLRNDFNVSPPTDSPDRTAARTVIGRLVRLPDKCLVHVRLLGKMTAVSSLAIRGPRRGRMGVCDSRTTWSP